MLSTTQTPAKRTALIIAQTAQYRRRVIANLRALREMAYGGSAPAPLERLQETLRLSKQQFRADYLRALHAAAPFPLPK